MRRRRNGESYASYRANMTDEEFEEYLAELAAMSPEEKAEYARKMDAATQRWNDRRAEEEAFQRECDHRRMDGDVATMAAQFNHGYWED